MRAWAVMGAASDYRRGALKSVFNVLVQATLGWVEANVGPDPL